MVPSHYLNQCWNIVNWTIRNKLQWILIEIHTLSFKKLPLKLASAKWRPFCLGLNVLMGPYCVLANIDQVTAWLHQWNENVILTEFLSLVASCVFHHFRCAQWGKFRQGDEISVPVEIFVTGWTGSWQNHNFRLIQWQKFRPHYHYTYVFFLLVGPLLS